MSTETNFSQIVRDGPFGARQAGVIALLGLLVLFDGMDTQMLAVIARDLMRDLPLPLSYFGLVFSIGLSGSVAGSLIMSPLADRSLGRKTIVVVAMAIASLSTIATPLAANLASLLALRFAAGLGLGAALPSIFTLVSEFSPRRLSRPITSTLAAFMPLGSLVGGLLGRALVPSFGWPMLLYVGGALTLALTLLAAWLLPESVYFLLAIKRDTTRAAAVARRLFPRLPAAALSVDIDPRQGRNQPVARLFVGGYWAVTSLLWLMSIGIQAVLYFGMSWTPALFEKSGLAATIGMNAAATFGLGGALGTLAQGWLATRLNIHKLMFAEAVLFIVAMLTLPATLGSPLLAPIMVFVIAAGVCAYQTGTILIVVEAYPDAVRTTGFGWTLGIGRIGATMAPVCAGGLVGLGWSAGQIYAAAAIPGALSAVALVASAGALRRVRSEGRSPAKGRTGAV